MTQKPRQGIKSVESLRAELDRLVDAEDWDGCLRIFDSLEKKSPLTAGELVRKSACLQLGSELGDLEGSEKALKAALDIARDYIPALLDLGWFYYSVQDDAKTALTYFLRAEKLSRLYLDEATEGKAKCLEEIRPEEVLS